MAISSPLKTINLSPHSHFYSLTHKSPFICNLSPSFYLKITAEPTLTLSSFTTFASVTITNLGSGFNFLGCVVDGLSDFFSLSVDPIVLPGELSISSISGKYAYKLSIDLLLNCASIFALAAVKLFKIHSLGLSLSLYKGLSLGLGLGSSTACWWHCSKRTVRVLTLPPPACPCPA